MTNHGVRNVLPLLLLLGVGMPAQAGLVDPVDEVSIDCSIECADLAPYKVSVVLAADLLQDGADAAGCLEGLFLEPTDLSCLAEDARPLELYQTSSFEYVLTTSSAWEKLTESQSSTGGCYHIVIPYLFGDMEPIEALQQTVIKIDCVFIDDAVSYVLTVALSEHSFITFASYY